MHNLITVISYLIEFLIAYYFFNDILIHKTKNSVSVIIGLLLYTTALCAFIIWNNSLINVSLFFLINITFSLICFKCSVKKAILSSLFFSAIMMGTEFISMSLLSITHSGNINTYNLNIAAYTICIIFSKMLFFLLTKLSIALGLHFSERKKSKMPSFLFLFPMCSLVILYTFWVISSKYNLSKNINIIISASSIAIIFSTILTYAFYGRTSKELDRLYQEQSEVERINTDTAYYAILDRQNEQLKTLIHDEKNHLTTIKSIAKNKELDDYIDSIYGKIVGYSLFGNTQNKMLDLMINKFQYICEAENIDFYVSIKTANLSYISSPDLITMLGNILDNAVEAAKLSNRKSIDLSINRVNKFDILTCSNSCESKPYAIGKTLLTTKSDTCFHGLGVNSIKNIVNKYDGSFEWNYNEDAREFVIYVSFNDQTNKI